MPVMHGYRTSNARNFKASFDDHEYFVCASGIEADNVVANSQFMEANFKNRLLFGKRVNVPGNPNAFFYAKNIRWVSGEVFDRYDDTKDLTTLNYYAVVYPDDFEGGDYHIFKCISNSNGGPSTTRPQYISGTPEQIYYLADGYVWKHMAAIEAEDFQKYGGWGFVPVFEADASPPSDDGIFEVVVENPDTNSGYTAVDGVVVTVLAGPTYVVSGGGPASPCVGDAELREIDTYYVGQTFYATNGAGVSKQYVIASYTYDFSSSTARITLVNDDNWVTSNMSFVIYPTIVFDGDGEGAQAIPVVVDGSIVGIRMTTTGTNYTRATATVVSPSFEYSGEAAVIRPVVSPYGGHGADLIAELCVRHVMVFSEFTFTDNLTIPTDVFYTKIGVLKNPAFDTSVGLFDNRLILEIPGNTLAAGDLVRQYDGTTLVFEATVQGVDGDFVYVVDYVKPYTRNAEIDELLDLVDEAAAVLPLNSITTATYIQGSGDLIYVHNMEGIQRTSESNEQFKIIFDF